MIRVLVDRNKEGQVKRVLVTGHANFHEYGKDIVCAAVSAISIGMVNAMETMFGVKMHADDDGDGKVECRLPNQKIDPEIEEKIRLQMETLVVMLKGVADEFPSYVTIKERIKS